MTRGLAARAGERSHGCREPGDPAAGLPGRAQPARASGRTCCPTSDAMDGSRSTSRWARFNTGQGAGGVLSGLAEAAERSAAAGNRVDELALRLDRAGYRARLEPTEQAVKRLRGARRGGAAGVRGGRRRVGAHRRLGLACPRRGYPELVLADVAAAAERVVEHARRADSRLMIDWGESTAGPCAVLRARRRWRSACAGSTSTLRSSGDSVLPYRDRLLAMLGRFDEAHQLLAEAADRVAGSGRQIPDLARVASLRASRCWRATRPARRRRRGRCCETAGVYGRARQLHVVLLQPRPGAPRARPRRRGRAVARTRARDAPSEERLPQMLWRQAAWQAPRATRRAPGGRAARARGGRARRRDGHAERARRRAARPRRGARACGQDARAELEQALALYERKGNLVMAERTRSRVAELAEIV